MSNMTANASGSSLFEPDQRMLELAAGYAIGDIEDAELSELRSYDSTRFNTLVQEFELVAANAFLVMANDKPLQQLAPELAGKIAQQARAVLQGSNPSVEPRALDQPSVNNELKQVNLSAKRNWREPLAWLCVAASLIALAGLNLPQWISNTRQPSLSQRWDKLVESPDAIFVRWEPGTTPIKRTGTDENEKVSGEIVWSTTKQEGYMSFEGLPVNDRTKEQYQLWIIDPTRDEKPVDGGVFDIVSSNDKVIVPINAKLLVSKPVVFAITIEQPGGVVVSKQDRLPLIAKVPEK